MVVECYAIIKTEISHIFVKDMFIREIHLHELSLYLFNPKRGAGKFPKTAKIRKLIKQQVNNRGRVRTFVFDPVYFERLEF